MTLPYDPSLIGARVGTGGDLDVYHYGSDKVIKISRFSHLFGSKPHDKRIRDIAIAKRYLSRFVVDTVDLTRKGTQHVELQEYVSGEQLCKGHCAEPIVREQLVDILAATDRMAKDGFPSIDLIGSGIFTSRLANIIVDQTDMKLRIIDAQLLESKSLGLLGWLIRPLIPIVRARQHILLRRFLH